MEELEGFDDSISMGMLMKYIVKPIKIEIVLGRYSATGLVTLSGGFLIRYTLFLFSKWHALQLLPYSVLTLYGPAWGFPTCER